MKRRESPFDVLLLIVLLVLGVLLGRLQSSSRDAGRLDFIAASAGRITDPIALPAGNITRATGEFFGGLFNARRLTLENERLRDLARAAELYNMQVTRLQNEIDQLRQLQGFGPVAGKTRIAAEVVGFSPYENRLTLNAGYKQGVGKGMPVEAPGGLVGTVQTVEANNCQVLMVTSTGLTIGALDISRNPPQAGFIRGENSALLTVTFQDPKAPIEIGDQIVTSGFSDLIPRAILIGRIISINADEEYGLLRARVDPAVSVGNLREVHILK